MILQALCQLAEREELVPEAGFEVKPLEWVINLTPDGELAGFSSYQIDEPVGKGKKTRRVGKPVLMPRQFYRSGTAPPAFFLVDNVKFIFGLPVGNTTFAPEDGIKFSNRFRALVTQCFEDTNDAELQAVVSFFERYPPGAAVDIPADARGNDMFAFKVGLGDFVHLRPTIKRWWALRSAAASGEGTAPFQCLVTGEPLTEIAQFPQVENVPGAPKPIKLISFNTKAFESYGLSRNENAPISENAAIKATTALNRLLNDRYPDPREPGSTLRPRNVRLSADTSACFWSAAAGREAQDWLNSLVGVLTADNEDTVGETYRSIWNGVPVKLKDPAAFYVLVISGAQGRAVVRDWIETTLKDTSQYLAEHFEDLKIVRNARVKQGSPRPPAVPLRALLESLAAEGKSENIPAPLETGFFRAAITGQPYPFQLLQRALVRERAEASRRDWLDTARKDARAAILKAVLNRRRRVKDSQASTRYPEVSEAMNPSLESPGYALGMLLAVLERLQGVALGDVNASIVDRYFSAASATPRAVFTRLLRNARHHARKALDAEEGSARVMGGRLERLIDEVMRRFGINARRLPQVVEGIPAHLDLEQQALFVLGYHQMRHWLWQTKEERAEWEANYPDAAPAFRWLKKENALGVEVTASA